MFRAVGLTGGFWPQSLWIWWCQANVVIYGYYKPEPARAQSPYVWAYVSFTGLGVQGWVEFLVDSGATSVSLHFADARRIGIRQDLLDTSSLRNSFGIGGTHRYYSESGSLSFDVESSVIQCNLDIRTAEDGPAASTRLPSLLGRDFLNLCDVRLNHSRGLVSLDPLNVERGFVLPP